VSEALRTGREFVQEFELVKLFGCQIFEQSGLKSKFFRPYNEELTSSEHVDNSVIRPMSARTVPSVTFLADVQPDILLGVGLLI
jgi:hypothetical protein